MESSCLPISDSTLSFLATNPSNRSANAAMKMSSKLNFKLPFMHMMMAKPPKNKLVKVKMFAVCAFNFLNVLSSTSGKNNTHHSFDTNPLSIVVSLMIFNFNLFMLNRKEYFYTIWR